MAADFVEGTIDIKIDRRRSVAHVVAGAHHLVFDLADFRLAYALAGEALREYDRDGEVVAFPRGKRRRHADVPNATPAS